MRGHLPQSTGFVGFISSLGGGAVVIWVVWQLAGSPMNRLEANATLPIVQRSHQWTETLLNYLPVVFLLTAVVASIAFVVFQTRFA
jgi:multisubunit Na+/H+ antiporter MnhC subunit